MIDLPPTSDKNPFFSGRTTKMPVGIVVSRLPGTTQWVSHIWKPTSLIPGACIAHWIELFSEGEVTHYHARTLELELHRAEVEAYRVSLSMELPSAFVIMDEDEMNDAPGDWQVTDVTLSPYLAQDLLDSGFSQVEAVPLPPVLVSWAQEFIDEHFDEEPFKKRKRDQFNTDLIEDGIGDSRVAKPGDIYMSPTALKKRKQH